jgi:protein SCO1/2
MSTPFAPQATKRASHPTLGPIAAALLSLLLGQAWGDTIPEVAPAAASALTAKVAFEQKLGAAVPLDAVFRDETGQPITLGYLLDGRRPAVLVLGYKDCPMLCSMVLGGLTETLTQIRLTTGRDFDLIDVSIDPKETPAEAAAQKRLYYKRYARPGADAGWHFLTSPDDATIHRLADAVGFRYAYDVSTKQYAHPSGVIVLTPEGKISQYFFGVTYEARDLHDALAAAGTHRIGSPIEQLLLLCFHYNPATSKYGGLIINGLRGAGVLTVLVLCGGLVWLIRGERQPPSSPA